MLAALILFVAATLAAAPTGPTLQPDEIEDPRRFVTGETGSRDQGDLWESACPWSPVAGVGLR
jgi:hypothetical protein